MRKDIQQLSTWVYPSRCYSSQKITSELQSSNSNNNGQINDAEMVSISKKRSFLPENEIQQSSSLPSIKVLEPTTIRVKKSRKDIELEASCHGAAGG